MENITNFLNALTPFLIVIIPILFRMWDKLSSKWNEEKQKQKDKTIAQNVEQFKNWKHEESMRVDSKAIEICDRYRDYEKVNASVLFLENGTVTATGISKMFFSCNAEDTRHTEIIKLSTNFNRTPYIDVAKWFECIQEDNNKVKPNDIAITYFTESDDKTYEKYKNSIFYKENKIKSMMASMIRNKENLAIIGVCIFSFSDSLTKEQMEEEREEFIKFIAAIETTYTDFYLSKQDYIDRNNIPEEERNR